MRVPFLARRSGEGARWWAHALFTGQDGANDCMQISHEPSPFRRCPSEGGTKVRTEYQEHYTRRKLTAPTSTHTTRSRCLPSLQVDTPTQSTTAHYPQGDASLTECPKVRYSHRPFSTSSCMTYHSQHNQMYTYSPTQTTSPSSSNTRTHTPLTSNHESILTH